MKISIKTTLIAGVTGLIVVLASTILFSALWRSEVALKRQAQIMMENISEFTIDKTENFLIPATEATDLVRKLTSSEVLAKQDKRQMANLFYNQLTIYSQFAGIFFGEPNGSFTYVSRTDSFVKNGFRIKQIAIQGEQRTVSFIYTNTEFKEIQRKLDPKDQYDPRKRPWYRKAIQGEGNIWTDPYIFFTSQNPGVTAAQSVFDKNGSFLGVIGIDIEIGELSAFISGLQIGKNGKAAIVDNTGTVIAFSDVAQMRIPKSGQSKGTRLAKITELQDPTIKRAFESLHSVVGSYTLNTAQSTSFRYNDQVYYALFKPFKNSTWPWTIGIYIPEEDYLEEIAETRFDTIVLALVFTVISIGIVLIISMKITLPLGALQKESEAIKQFDFDSSFPVHTVFSEIQETSDSFLQMKAGLQAFEQYVPKTLVRSIVSGNSPPDKEVKTLPVMFTDIENFTSISE